jgi:hypothetical protein
MHKKLFHRVNQNRLSSDFQKLLWLFHVPHAAANAPRQNHSKYHSKSPYPSTFSLSMKLL